MKVPKKWPLPQLMKKEKYRSIDQTEEVSKGDRSSRSLSDWLAANCYEMTSVKALEEECRIDWNSPEQKSDGY
jgi:hypothetical protein